MAMLFVGGVNDRSMIGLTLNDNGDFLYVVDGNCSLFDRLKLKKGLAFTTMIFGKGVMQRKLGFKSFPSLIFNQIADADTHRGALERCIELCDQIDAKVINHPRQVLQTSREQVAQKLQDIPGVIVPRTVRFQPRSPDEVFSRAAEEGLVYPYIIRTAGDHNGQNLVKVDGPEDYPALHALPFDGRDFYLIQFVDYRNEDGLYHKQRIIVIDGEPFLRHALYEDTWMVHANARRFMAEQQREQDDMALFDRLSDQVLPQLRPAIDEITNRLKLEYYGIDCSLRPDGQMLIFEANANMNVLHISSRASAYRLQEIENKLYEMLSRYSGEQVVKANVASVI